MALRSFLIGLMAAMVLLLQGCIIIPITGFGSSDGYGEVQLKEGRAGKRILVLDLEGAITSGAGTGGMWSSTSTVVEMTEKLRIAAKDKSIKAVVLRVDSPGGGVTASDIIYKALRDYREETGVPVYASFLDIAASGGYYIAMGADEVYASPTTVTGSIGVIAMFPQIESMGNKIGVSMEVIKSGRNKDMASMWKKMESAERKILQDMIDDMYNRFVAVVQEGRPQLTGERIRELGDGRIYTAAQAAENGLVDGVLYLDEVIDHAATENGLRKPQVFMYRRTMATQTDTIYASGAPLNPKADTNNTTVNVLSVTGDALQMNGPVFQYLWMP